MKTQPMDIKTIIRKGNFTPVASTCNQCREVGWEDYHYEVVCCFENIQLDENGWIVDHNVINDAIQNIPIKGSCEEMHDMILKSVRKALLEHDMLDDLVAVKTVIKAGKNPPAFMINCWIKHPIYTAFLNM